MEKTTDIFYRKCDKCGIGMNEGYIMDSGDFCSLDCAGLTYAEWDEIYDEDGDQYWTEWEEADDEDAPIYNAKGETL